MVRTWLMLAMIGVALSLPGRALAVPIAFDFDISSVTSPSGPPESLLDGDDSVSIIFDPDALGGPSVLLFEIPGVVRLTEANFFPLSSAISPDLGGPNDLVELTLSPQGTFQVGNLFVGTINLSIFGADFITDATFPTVAALNDGITNGGFSFSLENSGGQVNTLLGTGTFSVVPLPAPLWLLLGGLGLLAYAGRRQPA